MKKKKTDKAEPAEVDDLRPEYDFAKMSGGVRGKYVERYRAGTNPDPKINSSCGKWVP